MILAAGLSPAWQQILVFDSFTAGKVNRANEVHWCASGKVLNVARALFHLGADCKAITVTGGIAGGALREDFLQLGIPARWIECRTPTRVCTTLIDEARHTSTELVPNSAALSDREREVFRAAYAEEERQAATVVLIGSLPLETPATYYRELISCTAGRVILDARGTELLEALAARPFLVKPNRAELEQTLGRRLLNEQDLLDGMREIVARGAEWVVVTDGKHPVYACSDSQGYHLQPPTCRVMNPIGCGDCMAAGIAWALAEGREPVEAIQFGVAAAASKIENLLPGLVSRAQVIALAAAVEIVRL